MKNIVRVRSDFFSIPEQKLHNFLCGVAMSAPFYADFISWNLLYILILPISLYSLISNKNNSFFSRNIIPFYLIFLLHAISLIFTETQFEYQIIKDMVIAFTLFFIYAISDEDITDAFLVALLPLGLITAITGLAKATLLENGYLIGYILDNCPNYPAGSSLCINYNNLGMLWLITAIGCIQRRYWIIIPILVTAGLLCGSRRFLVLAPILPIAWIFLQRKRGLYKSSICLSLTFLCYFLITNPDHTKTLQETEAGYKVILDFKHNYNDEDNYQLPVSMTYSSVLLDTMKDGKLGTSTRLDFWKLAITRISWLPNGWAYHKTYSCTFSACTDFHYPHMPILSASLAGGITFGIFALLFYLLPAISVIRSKNAIIICLFISILPYSLISGDTIFSLPTCLSVIFVSLKSSEIRRNIISVQTKTSANTQP